MLESYSRAVTRAVTDSPGLPQSPTLAPQATQAARTVVKVGPSSKRRGSQFWAFQAIPSRVPSSWHRKIHTVVSTVLRARTRVYRVRMRVNVFTCKGCESAL